ncbi:MAG: alanine racemase C-terminal domain-containing protein [Flavobacteriaceae bacterium]|nr:alanine racemase C-terminal domain-containing protein [Flavobacteriaceae bacterium]
MQMELKGIWSNGRAEVIIHGKKAPVVGKVCMCITMVDVTEIDCQEGDEVIIFNCQDHVLALAKSADTIPYEILTSISQRVRRIVIE